MSRIGNKVSRLSQGTQDRQDHRKERYEVKWPPPIRVEPVTMSMKKAELEQIADDMGLEATGTKKEIIELITKCQD